MDNLKQQLNSFAHDSIIWIGTLKSEILVAFLVFLVSYLLINELRKLNSKFPPGPYGLPIVGYVPYLTKDVHLQFIELGKKYGNVFSLKLGSQRVVILNGAEVIREAFSKPEYLGRPPQNAFDVFDRESPFFVCGNDVWTEHRRFVVQSMKDLGLGKSKIVSQIQDEISNLLTILSSYSGAPFDLCKPLSPSMSNNICALVFGERYEYDDPERQMLDSNLNLVADSLGQTSAHIFFPWLRHMPFFLKFLGVEEAIRAYKNTAALMWRKVKQHEETLDPNNIRDYIDSYLVEMKYRKEKNMNTTLSDKTFIGSVSDLFGAGSETVRTTILWCVYTMAAYPAAQKRAEAEIDAHLGAHRSPEFGDMKHMPYAQAVIKEILRWKTIVPLNILRYTLADTTLRGFNIPKGTTVMANFWAAHHDPNLWENPEVFMPERFLSDDGLSVKKSSNFMPFSIGKRACPGENMANIEVFLYFVSILQKFDVTFPKGTKPTFDAELGVTYKLKPYLVHFTPRN